MQTRRLRALAPEVLAGIRRGIEKESLRVHPDGTLATTPHPEALGSPLTHPHITTDFSESQLELITGVHTRIDACLEELADIHRAVYRHLGDEMLWCASMPCALPPDDQIPIAQYGRSNIGRLKTVYRIGLSYRYGRRMQTISGVHYNFSLPDEAWPALQAVNDHHGPERVFRDEAYFGLIRNFRRHSWLLLYLFGASPAACESFVSGRRHKLERLAEGTRYLPYATSLRMGPLGYQSDAQATLAVSYNSLESYAASLRAALNEPYPAYEAIGISVNGDYRQLSPTLLQIENEFYGTIRPKRRTRRGERPIRALRARGVEYVEVRCLDLDPYSPIGVAATTMRFLDVFLLHCLLSDSPPDSPEEIAEKARNQHRVAERGRDPALRLTRHGKERSVAEWGSELLAQCEAVAAALDEANGGSAYREALSAASSALANPDATPSARMLRDMAQDFDQSYLRFITSRSATHKQTIVSQPQSAGALARFERLAAESVRAREEIEAADTVPFEQFRREYVAMPE